MRSAILNSILKTNIAILVSSLLSVSVYAQNLEQPKIKSGKIELGKDIKKAVKAENPKFKIFNLKSFSKTSIDLSNDSPMAVVSDFNADGINDIALYGFDSSTKKALIYMVVSSKEKGQYQAHLVESMDLDKSITSNNDSYLTENQLLKYNRNVLLVEYFGEDYASHTIYYFSIKNNKVIQFDKSDTFID